MKNIHGSYSKMSTNPFELFRSYPFILNMLFRANETTTSEKPAMNPYFFISIPSANNM